MLRILSKYANYEYDRFNYKMGTKPGDRYPLDFLQYDNGIGVYFTTADYDENLFEIDPSKKYLGTNNVNRFLNLKQTNTNLVFYPLFLNNGSDLYMINESNTITNVLNIDSSTIVRLIKTDLNSTFTQSRVDAILEKFDSMIAIVGEMKGTNPIISPYTLSTSQFVIDFETEHTLNTYLNTLYVSQRPEHITDFGNIHNLLFNFLLLSVSRDRENAYWFTDDVDMDVFMDVLITLLYGENNNKCIVDNAVLKHCEFDMNDIYQNVLKLKFLIADCLHPDFDIFQFNACATISDMKTKLMTLMGV